MSSGAHAPAARARTPCKLGKKAVATFPQHGAGTHLAAPRAMRDRHIVIVGGGLAGLSAGAYARASGFRTTILEHNVALGGVCTAWPRGPYTVDGCIHWLTGGAFNRVYEELGILADRADEDHRDLHHVPRHAERDRDPGDARSRRARARLGAPRSAGRRGDRADDRGGARHRRLRAPVDAPELATLRQSLASLWDLKGDVGVLMRFRKPLGLWAQEHLRSETLRHVLTQLMPPESPALALLGVLGYLERGYLSRPVGGTARFRDALIATYQRLGGVAQLHTTVEEILVRGHRAYGVRLADGTVVEGDAVISTASTPETVFRLLGGRYGADEMRERMRRWKLFDPIVLVSFGVEIPLEGVPSMMLLDHVEPLDVGGVENDRLYLRVCNDDPSFAPPGHTVVQAMLRTDYDWWAGQGSGYGVAKEELAGRVLERLDAHLPGIVNAVRMTDVATPLTYWNTARSWRGAYEGWQPNEEGFFGHQKRTLPGLEGLYLAGQWLEPGGGVPPSLASGRQVVQRICAEEKRAFVASPAHVTPRALDGAGGLDRERPVLVVYASREGQTKLVAEHVAANLRERGFQADVRDARTSAPRALDRYAGAIIAGSVHMQRHEPELEAFVRKNRDELEHMRTAFLSVSLAEAGAEDATLPQEERDRAIAQVDALVHGFFDRTGWHPDQVRPVAGALAYTKYAAPTRLAMKLIAKLNRAGTDTSKDHSYTDWQAIDRFVEGFCEARAV